MFKFNYNTKRNSNDKNNMLARTNCTADSKKAAVAMTPMILLLLQFSLLISQCIADECGTKFTDPSSSTVLAQIVIEGKVDSLMPAPHHSQTHSANITIGKVYKGMEVLKQMGVPPENNVMVDKFGTETIPDECIAGMSAMESEQELLFFLRPSSSHGVLQMTALPLPAEHRVKKTVEASLCETCVTAPEIHRVMCQQCAYAPVIIKGRGRKVKVGQKARIGCFARGKPYPRFSWTNSGVLITSGSGGIVIKSNNASSILFIMKAAKIHRGQYTCRAENDLGTSEKTFTLEVTRHARPPKPKYKLRNAPDKRICDRAVCLNGGTCYYSPSLDLSFCKCIDGFEGVKCENDISGSKTAPYAATSTRGTTSAAGAGMIPCAQLNVRSICLNGGTCYIKQENLICSCLQGFDGGRCQHVSSFSSDENSSRSDSVADNMVNTSFDTTPFLGLNEVETFSEVKSETIGTTTDYDETYTTSQRSTTDSPTFTTQPMETDKSMPPMHHSNVDKEALIIIRSQIVNKGLDTDECSLVLSAFCENGGTCRYVHSLNVAVCMCPEGFTGTRCETNSPGEAAFLPSKSVPTPPEDLQARVFSTDVSQFINPPTARPTSKHKTRKSHPIFDNADNVACFRTNICQNGATCYYSISTARTLCICPEGFEGSRCDTSISDAVNHRSKKHQRVSEKLKRNDFPSSGSPAGDIDDEALSDILSRIKSSRIKASRCKSKSFCLNNGKCRYIHKLSLQVCLCRTGYTGRRCELQLIAFGYSSL